MFLYHEKCYYKIYNNNIKRNSRFVNENHIFVKFITFNLIELAFRTMISIYSQMLQ